MNESKGTQSIYDVLRKWQRRGADVRLAVSHEPGKPPRLEIDFIGIPKASRCKGYGSKIMKELMRAADSKKMDIALTPEKSDRSERSRKFFQQHGFREATDEDGRFTWMVRKVFRREHLKSVQAQGPKEVEKARPTSLFMENAKKFKRGDKAALSGYSSTGKIEHTASGAKSSYGLLAGGHDQERRPPPPSNVPEGHFASWNEEKKEYELVPKKQAYGGVVFNDHGEILLRMAAVYTNGYVWTFPVGIDNQQGAPEEIAMREVAELTGVKAEIRSDIPGSFEDELTSAHFYAMQIVSADHSRSAETAQITWVKPAEALAYLSQTTNEKGRKRDASLLDAVRRYASEAFEKKLKDSFNSEWRDAAGIRNALVYWGRKEHRAEHSPREQREILARLLMAAYSQGLDPEALSIE